jgi:putative membrane protein
MIRSIVIGLATVAMVAILPATGTQGAEQAPKPNTHAFLKKAGEMQEAQIALGRLASERAANKRVKELGEEMIGAHKRLSRDVQDHAARLGVQLPSELSEEHKKNMKELSQLSGHAFDRTYLQYILRDHQNDVNEFEGSMQTVEDADVLHWSYRVLPMLRAHVEEARWAKMVLHAID